MGTTTVATTATPAKNKVGVMVQLDGDYDERISFSFFHAISRSDGPIRWGLRQLPSRIPIVYT